MKNITNYSRTHLQEAAVYKACSVVKEFEVSSPGQEDPLERK